MEYLLVRVYKTRETRTRHIAFLFVTSTMLSKRAATSASDLDIPWRYINAGQRGRYDPDTNPTGIITQFTSAENYLVQEELAQYVKAKVNIHGQTLEYGYSTAGGEELPKALAAHLNEYWKPWKLLSGDEIKITGAATALHEILGFSIADPGQGMLRLVREVVQRGRILTV